MLTQFCLLIDEEGNWCPEKLAAWLASPMNEQRSRDRAGHLPVPSCLALLLAPLSAAFLSILTKIPAKMDPLENGPLG